VAGVVDTAICNVPMTFNLMPCLPSSNHLAIKLVVFLVLSFANHGLFLVGLTLLLAAVEAYDKTCRKFTDYSLQYASILLQLCNDTGGDSVFVVSNINKYCR
jgi:hypothetical protein